MAAALGKLAILVGAGIYGSSFVKEYTVSDVISGAFKIAFKQIKQDDSKIKIKPHNDSLMAQVNSLRQELQILASNRSITIVSTDTAGGGRYRVIVLVVIAGYGYIWWKGWKLPDFAFATRRSLSDACNSVAKQLENVYSSLSATKRELSSRIESVDSRMESIKRVTADTEKQVSDLSSQVGTVGVDVNSIRTKIQNMETKINRIEGKQDTANEGVRKLVEYAWSLENGRTADRLQASSSGASRLALEPRIRHSTTGISRAAILPLESPSSPAAIELPKVRQPVEVAASSSGLREPIETSETPSTSSNPEPSGRNNVLKETSSEPLSSGRLGRMLSGFSSFLSRTGSAEEGSSHHQMGQQSGLGALNGL